MGLVFCFVDLGITVVMEEFSPFGYYDVAILPHPFSCIELN